MNHDDTMPSRDAMPGAAGDPLWDEAWAWLTRQHEQGAHDKDTLEGLTRWLATSFAHRKAYEQASRLWLLSGLLPPVHDLGPPDGD